MAVVARCAGWQGRLFFERGVWFAVGGHSSPRCAGTPNRNRTPFCLIVSDWRCKSANAASKAAIPALYSNFLGSGVIAFSQLFSAMKNKVLIILYPSGRGRCTRPTLAAVKSTDLNRVRRKEVNAGHRA